MAKKAKPVKANKAKKQKREKQEKYTYDIAVSTLGGLVCVYTLLSILGVGFAVIYSLLSYL